MVRRAVGLYSLYQVLNGAACVGMIVHADSSVALVRAGTTACGAWNASQVAAAATRRSDRAARKRQGEEIIGVSFGRRVAICDGKNVRMQDPFSTALSRGGFDSRCQAKDLQNKKVECRPWPWPWFGDLQTSHSLLPAKKAVTVTTGWCQGCTNVRTFGDIGS
jgi:hypothetical protein